MLQRASQTVVDFYHGAADAGLVEIVHEHGSLAGLRIGSLDDAEERHGRMRPARCAWSGKRVSGRSMRGRSPTNNSGLVGTFGWPQFVVRSKKQPRLMSCSLIEVRASDLPVRRLGSVVSHVFNASMW